MVQLLISDIDSACIHAKLKILGFILS